MGERMVVAPQPGDELLTTSGTCTYVERVESYAPDSNTWHVVTVGGAPVRVAFRQGGGVWQCVGPSHEPVPQMPALPAPASPYEDARQRGAAVAAEFPSKSGAPARRAQP